MTNHFLFSSYLDAIIEQQMPMTGASMFWLDTLFMIVILIDHFHYHTIDIVLRMNIELVVEHRFHSTSVMIFRITFSLMAYHAISTLNIWHLACYYILLFKLTNGEKDLCIGMNTHGRYKEELMSVIGMFENIIPLRCRVTSLLVISSTS